MLPIVVAALAGYAFAWLEFPGRDWLFIVVIGLLVVPLQMALIPIFSFYNAVGMFDTVLGLVLFHTAFGLPFAIFLLRNFFIGIPKDILESARIDGASEFRIFVRLILPLGLPAIASLAIFQFLWTWNDLLVGADVRPGNAADHGRDLLAARQFGSNIEIIAPASFVSLPCRCSSSSPSSATSCRGCSPARSSSASMLRCNTWQHIPVHSGWMSNFSSCSRSGPTGSESRRTPSRRAISARGCARTSTR